MSAHELTPVETSAAKRAIASPLPPPRPVRVPTSRRHGLGGLSFAVLVVAVIAAGMIGLLALNTYLQDQAFQLGKARNQSAALALELSNKQAEVYAKAAPGELAAQAGALGMVPNPYLGAVDLRTGKVVGSPKAVTGDELSALRVSALTPAAVPSGQQSPDAATHVPTTQATSAGAATTASPSTRTTAKATTTPTRP